jgi:hypothetical protein
VLDHPYVTVSEFRAHPTFLDSNNLRSGGTQPQQDAALNNALLTASQWAEDTINMPLAAHTVVEHARVRPDAMGRLRYHPEHAPVLTVSAIAIGPTPDALEAVSQPQAWLEQQGRVLVAYGPGAPALASLQFGSSLATRTEVLVQWSYIAGYPATQLATGASSGATSITVLDATGIQAASGITPATVLRLWTPALEEAVTVASVAGSTLTLATPLTNNHPAGMSCSALPTTARQAVINYAAAELMRPAPLAQTNQAPGAPSPAASSQDPQRSTGGARLIAQALQLLNNYQRIR